MFAKKTTNPLHNTVEQIVVEQSRNKQVRHSAFASVRNQASVRKILEKLGFTPDCQAKPIMWSARGLENLESKPVNRRGADRNYRKRVSPKHDALLSKLENEGKVYVADINITHDYAAKIIIGLKETGWNIEPIMLKTKGDVRAKTIGWQLIKEAK